MHIISAVTVLLISASLLLGATAMPTPEPQSLAPSENADQESAGEDISSGTDQPPADLRNRLIGRNLEIVNPLFFAALALQERAEEDGYVFGAVAVPLYCEADFVEKLASSLVPSDAGCKWKYVCNYRPDHYPHFSIVAECLNDTDDSCTSCTSGSTCRTQRQKSYVIKRGDNGEWLEDLVLERLPNKCTCGA